MASELRPESSFPWKIDAENRCNILDSGGFIGDFTLAADAAYAVKAVNMHERLVEALRNMLTADIVNVGYVQALLKEAADD